MSSPAIARLAGATRPRPTLIRGGDGAMKALVYTGPLQLDYTDRPAPVAATGEVLVRVKAVAICGSDVHGYTGTTGRRIPPVVMGHEASGVIEAVGPGTEGWAPGARVTFDSIVWCGACRPCLLGRTNLCETRQTFGVSTPAFRRDGAMAEYVVVPARLLHQLPDAVSFDAAAMVEPAAVAMHAARISEIQTGDLVVVVGAGLIGILAMQAARMLGAGVVAIADVVPERLELARRLGADVTIDSGDGKPADSLEHDVRGRGGRHPKDDRNGDGPDPARRPAHAHRQRPAAGGAGPAGDRLGRAHHPRLIGQCGGVPRLHRANCRQASARGGADQPDPAAGRRPIGLREPPPRRARAHEDRAPPARLTVRPGNQGDPTMAPHVTLGVAHAVRIRERSLQSADPGPRGARPGVRRGPVAPRPGRDPRLARGLPWLAGRVLDRAAPASLRGGDLQGRQRSGTVYDLSLIHI